MRFKASHSPNIEVAHGQYHDVDSSDMAFKIAGSLAFKEAMKRARPALLEPIMQVEVHAPDKYSGELMGHLSGRRGKINGSEARAGNVWRRFQKCSARERANFVDAGPGQLFHGIFALRSRSQ